MRNRKKAKAIIIAVVASWMATNPLRAQTASWATATSGAWSTATNWNPAVVPGATTSVYFSTDSTASYTATLSTTATIANMAFTDAFGVLKIDNAAKLNVAGEMSHSAGTVDNAGSVSSRTANFLGRAIVGGGTVHLSANSLSAQLLISGDAQINQTFAFDGYRSNSYLFAQPSGAMSGGHIAPGMTLIFSPRSDVSGTALFATLTATGTPVAGAAGLCNFGTLILAGSTADFANLLTLETGGISSTLTNDGLVRFDAGSIALNTRAVTGNVLNRSGQMVVAPTVSLAIAGGTFTNRSLVNLPSTSTLSVSNFNQEQGTLVAAGTTNVSTFNFSGGVVNGTVNLPTDGALVIAAGVSGSGTFVIPPRAISILRPVGAADGGDIPAGMTVRVAGSNFGTIVAPGGASGFTSRGTINISSQANIAFSNGVRNFGLINIETGGFGGKLLPRGGFINEIGGTVDIAGTLGELNNSSDVVNRNSGLVNVPKSGHLYANLFYQDVGTLSCTGTTRITTLVSSGSVTVTTAGGGGLGGLTATTFIDNGQLHIGAGSTCAAGTYVGTDDIVDDGTMIFSGATASQVQSKI